MLQNPICSFAGHKINRHRVWHDGLNFRTDCDRCSKQMIRVSHGWTAFDEEAHGNPNRSSKEEALQATAS